MDSEFSKHTGHKLIRKETDLRFSQDDGIELAEQLDDLGQGVDHQATAVR